MLKNNGYKNYTIATSAANALKKLKKDREINFIILDWEMPFMNGIELLNHLRKSEYYADIPVLMLIEDITDKKILYAIGEGADGYMEKPFSEKELLIIINQVLQAKLQPDPMRYHIQRIHSLRLQRQINEAISEAKKILEKHNNESIMLALSQCYLTKKNFRDAKLTTQKAIDMSGSYQAYHLFGKICIEEGSFEESIEYLQKAYEINPMLTDALIDMGKAYLNLGNTKEATDLFGALQDSDLTDFNYTSIASAYLGTGDMSTAGKYLEEARAPMLESIGIFNKYAIELRKAGQLDEAIEQYKRCLRIDPLNHILILNTALTYTELKNFEEAEKLLVKCLDIDPNYENAKRLLNFVRSKKFN